jgi:putative permease
MRGVQTRHTVQMVALFSTIVLLVVVLYIGGVAEIVAIAVLLAYILNPMVTYLEYRGVPRGLASGVILLAVVGVGALLWIFLSPIAVEQIRSLKAGNASFQAHKVIASIQSLLDDRLDFLGFDHLDLNAEVHQFKLAFAERIPGAVLEGSITFAIGLVMTPFLMFFFLKDGSQIKRYFISMVPNRYFEFAMDLIYKMDVQLGNYLRGQFIDALVFGALTTMALWVLGVPYFVFIGIFAGLANLVPFVGPIAGASAAVSAVLVEQGDVGRVVTVIAVFVGLKLIDDFGIQPMAVGKTVDLHPVAVALGILVAGHFFGVIGMLLIVPLMGFLKVVLEESVQTYRRYRFD